MRILVVEDEFIVSQSLIRLTTEILGEDLESIRHVEDLYDGLAYVRKYPIDLLLLDLNLNGSDGFEILAEVVAGSFQTIVVSAHADRAISAFEYGVTDFVAKPFTKERLQKALERARGRGTAASPRMKYLAVRRAGEVRAIEVADVQYLKGADDYCEIHCRNGEVLLHDKTLHKLETRLPENFQRAHRSYLINMNLVTGYETRPGSRYRVILSTGERVPVSRKKMYLFRRRFPRESA